MIALNALGRLKYLPDTAGSQAMYGEYSAHVKTWNTQLGMYSYTPAFQMKLKGINIGHSSILITIPNNARGKYLIDKYIDNDFHKIPYRLVKKKVPTIKFEYEVLKYSTAFINSVKEMKHLSAQQKENAIKIFKADLAKRPASERNKQVKVAKRNNGQYVTSLTKNSAYQAEFFEIYFSYWPARPAINEKHYLSSPERDGLGGRRGTPVNFNKDALDQYLGDVKLCTRKHKGLLGLISQQQYTLGIHCTVRLPKVIDPSNSDNDRAAREILLHLSCQIEEFRMAENELYQLNKELKPKKENVGLLKGKLGKKPDKKLTEQLNRAIHDMANCQGRINAIRIKLTEIIFESRQFTMTELFKIIYKIAAVSKVGYPSLKDYYTNIDQVPADLEAKLNHKIKIESLLEKLGDEAHKQDEDELKNILISFPTLKSIFSKSMLEYNESNLILKVAEALKIFHIKLNNYKCTAFKIAKDRLALMNIDIYSYVQLGKPPDSEVSLGVFDKHPNVTLNKTKNKIIKDSSQQTEMTPKGIEVEAVLREMARIVDTDINGKENGFEVNSKNCSSTVLAILQAGLAAEDKRILGNYFIEMDEYQKTIGYIQLPVSPQMVYESAIHISKILNISKSKVNDGGRTGYVAKF